MNPICDLTELQFSYRAFVAYLNELLMGRKQGRTLIDGRPIELEISKTEERLEDLDILIKRKSHED